MDTRRGLVLAGLTALATVLATETVAQPYEPGPLGRVPGSSVSGMRIDGAPRVRRNVDIPRAKVFGDTVEERAYGREYDDSYLRPKIVQPRAAPPVELRATEGRSDLNTINSGVFSRSDPGVISRSGVTRPQLKPPRVRDRARIVE